MAKAETLNTATAAASTENTSKDDKSKLLEAKREFLLKIREFKTNNVSKAESQLTNS